MPQYDKYRLSFCDISTAVASLLCSTWQIKTTKSRDKSPMNECECDFVWSRRGKNKRKSETFRTCFENEQKCNFCLCHPEPRTK